MSRVLKEGKLHEAKPGSYLNVRATIVQIFEPKFFEDKHNPGQQRALVTFVLDDGTETVRCLFNERTLEQLGLSSADIFSAEIFATKRASLLGEELSFVGSFKINTYFNNLEMNAERAERIEPEALIKSLEHN